MKRAACDAQAARLTRDYGDSHNNNNNDDDDAVRVYVAMGDFEKSTRPMIKAPLGRRVCVAHGHQ